LVLVSKTLLLNLSEKLSGSESFLGLESFFIFSLRFLSCFSALSRELSLSIDTLLGVLDFYFLSIDEPLEL